MNPSHKALGGRISQALLDLDQVVSRTEFLMNKARQTGDDGYLDGVALNLHSFYTGVERILEDIARTMEKSIPSGANWHQALLLQMSASMNSVRPAVISRETRYCLDEYRGFRHVVRNVYTFNLKSSRLQELTEQLRECCQSVQSDLEKFMNFLEQLAKDE
ncbi:MAG: hypothetical protein B6245_18865 [Desulfobacteraceae bacterium 4572_88]|nr:MAG: hypothetical protein B6245_18865 [Desulfobacteraceae bacterium 4572_88]